jgi:hypothetical protein
MNNLVIPTERSEWRNLQLPFPAMPTRSGAQAGDLKPLSGN